MGQRHMTYVLVEDASAKPYSNDVAMLALYNQWNFETIQPVKVIRFLEALKQWEKNKAVVGVEDVARLYEHAASVSPYSLCKFTPENDLYDATYGMYDEDNNNGWQIVYVKYNRDNRSYQVHVGFKPGNEWRDDYESQGYLSLKDYLDGYLGNDDVGEKENSFEEFVAQHNRKEQAVLKKISRSFEAKEIARAEVLIRREIEKIQARKAKQAA